MRWLSVIAGRALCLGAVLALAACAAPVASETGASPLRLDFLWSPRPKPTIRIWPDAPPPPRAVVVRWNSKDYSKTAITQIAGQQCITFGDKAVAAGAVHEQDGMNGERFNCVVTTKNDAGGRG